MFHRYKPQDRIYLTPIKTGDQELSEDQIQILFCDSKGILTTSVIETSLMEVLKDKIKELREAGKWSVAVCIEIEKGQSASLPIEISYEQAEAIDKMLRSVNEFGYIPNELIKHAKKIINKAESKRKAVKIEYINTHSLFLALTPKMAEYLEKTPDSGIEVTWQNEKIEPVHPVILLDKLPPNDQTRSDMQRVLVIDSEGSSAIIRIPIEAVNEAEQDLEQLMQENRMSGVVVVSKQKEGFTTGTMVIRESQKKALDQVKKHFEKTGYSMPTVSTDVMAVLVRAKEYLPSKDTM